MEDVDVVMLLLPALLGVAVLAYLLGEFRSRRAELVGVMRNWLVVILALATASLWVLLIFGNLVLGLSQEIILAICSVFAIALAWVSMCAIALVTIYRRHGLADEFRYWLRAEPVNILSVSGVIGLGLVIGVIASASFSDTPLDEQTWTPALVASYVLVIIAFDIAAPPVTVKRGGMPPLQRRGAFAMGAMAVAWTGIPLAVLVLGCIPSIVNSLGESNPIIWVTVILLILMARTAFMSKSAAITIEAEVEKREGFRNYDIPRGVYLIEDEKSDPSIALFSDLITLPLTPAASVPGKEVTASATLEYLIPKGLMITRDFPDSVRTKFNLHVTPIIWLTESLGEMRIAPTSLAVLADTITRFMESNPNSIVLLDGVEYMSTFSEFRKVLRSLDLLNETCWITRSRLLISVNPSAFESKDLALLERDRKIVRGSKGIEELKRESAIP